MLGSHHLDHSHLWVFLGHDTFLKHSPFRKGFNSAEKQFTHNVKYFTKFWTSQNAIAYSEKNTLTFWNVCLVKNSVPQKWNSRTSTQSKASKTKHFLWGQIKGIIPPKIEDSGEKDEDREQAIKFPPLPSSIPSEPEWQAAYFSVWKS